MPQLTDPACLSSRRALKCQIFLLYAVFVTILLMLPKKQRNAIDSSDGKFYSWWLWTNTLLYVIGGLGLVVSILGVVALDLSVPTYALEDDRMSRKGSEAGGEPPLSVIVLCENIP